VQTIVATDGVGELDTAALYAQRRGIGNDPNARCRSMVLLMLRG